MVGTLESSKGNAFGRKPQPLNKICVLSTLWSRSCFRPREQEEPAALQELMQVVREIQAAADAKHRAFQQAYCSTVICTFTAPRWAAISVWLKKKVVEPIPTPYGDPRSNSTN